MTIVSDDPSWWPLIDSNIVLSYWIVAAGVVVVYDWVLILGQEVELIWANKSALANSSPLTISTDILEFSPFVSLTDAGFIMIARLHAMYQGSRMMLIFLVIIFLGVNIACGVMTAIDLEHNAAGQIPEELILSGTYMCDYGFGGDNQLLNSMVWMLDTVLEVLALCLSVWVAVKHFRDLRRLDPSTGSIIGDCFRVLMKSHVLYFASFVCVSCLKLATISPELKNSHSIGDQILNGALEISFVVQIFVLGPRLILSVREYHANLVADSDAETSMNSIVFQERVHVSTSSTV
ncbi:uncharacterized protein F5147DRAFT_655732 [Suillus discolor]|uniref:DUF6533 domain-containing protein n=1 Tax=Suillus discolor TaxID=1912936 RepID=A0A9P7F069_9AGAM|nr:uncharacterized protein F5147DRAFT_655732 [Suillus discolor]KAG2099899.1 hypothetical protein F5147DRAFT_655732 [Suillus discolor]